MNFLTNSLHDTHREGDTFYITMCRWVLSVGVALTPLFFIPWTSNVQELNKQLLIVVVAAIGLVLWLLDVMMSGKLSWRLNPLDKGILVFAVAVFISSIFSAAKFKSVFGVAGNLSDSALTIASLTVIYLLIVNSFDGKGKAVRYLFSISLTLGLIYGFLQLLGVHIFRYFDTPLFQFAVSRTFNTFGSVNVLGMVAAVSLPMLYKTKISIFRYFDILKIGVFAALAILIIINWWILWAVAIVGMISVMVLESIVPAGRERVFKLSKFLFPMVVMVLSTFLVIINFNLVFIKKNLPIEIAPSHRLSSEIAVKTLKEKPILGHGPENFSLAFDRYGAEKLRNTNLSGIKFFDSASQVFNLAVHGGILGLAALGFILWIFGQSLFGFIKSNLIGFDLEDIGTVSSAVAVIFASFLYPFNISLIFFLYLLLGLYVLAIWGKQKSIYNIESKASLSLISSLGFISGLIISLVGLYFVSLGYVAELNYVKALAQTNSQKALGYVAESIKWKGNDDRFYRLSSQMALDSLSNELKNRSAKDGDQRQKRMRDYVTSAVNYARQATETAPNEPENWANLGDVYQNLLTLVSGSDALAEAAYLKASELRPGDPSFYHRVGNMYLARADFSIQLAANNGAAAQKFNQDTSAALLKAEDALKKAIGLSNNLGLAIYNLGLVYERQGKLSEAIKQLEKLAPSNDDQPGLAFELGLLYYRADRKNKALDQLQRAVVLFPDYANARWYLALIYEEKKEIDQAISQLERILSMEVNKGNETVIKKLNELKTGRVRIPPGKVLDQKPL